MVTLSEKVAARFLKADSADVERIQRLSERLSKSPDWGSLVEMEKLLEKYARSVRMANPSVAKDAYALSGALGNLREHIKEEIKETVSEIDEMFESVVF